MSFQEHSIFAIDEYILLRNKGNEFLSIVEHYFRSRKLTFSLLEMVLLFEKGIGETYIFAKDDFDANHFYKQYIDLVTKFKNDFSGGISAYKEWYHQNTWILIGEGEKQFNTYSVSSYNWVGEFEPKEIKSYGEKRGLTGEIISEYFNRYADAIATLELKKHPNYFIVIHPICKLEKNQIVPYGNLYLHFCTVEKVTVEEIKGFLKEFMVIWYKCYGGHNHKAVLQKLLGKVLANDDVKYYLPSELGSHGDDLKILFMQYFIKEGSLANFKKKTDEFIAKLQTFADRKETSDYPEVKEYKSAPSFADLIINYTDQAFENFLFKRALAIFFLICKKFSIENTKKLLMKKESTSKNKKSDTDYFYQYLHIYLPETEGLRVLRENLQKGDKLSDFEKAIASTFATTGQTS